MKQQAKILLTVLSLVCFFALPAHAQTLVDYYNSGDNNQGDFQGSEWLAQTFEASETFDISRVKVKMYRVGSPGTLTVSIRATSAGLPTGSDLVSGSFNANTMVTSSPGDWYEITFGTAQTLTVGNTYAIVVRATGGDINNLIYWRTDTTAGYANGQRAGSTDSGASWSAVSGQDLMFETYAGTGTPATTTPTSTVEMIAVAEAINELYLLQTVGIGIFIFLSIVLTLWRR